MKTKIIFVDDEPNIINGLKRMLYSMKKEWDMKFVLSGDEALSKMEEESFDVIVSDMRMPKMDGAELLKIIQEKYPRVVRIILSGHSDNEMAIRSTRSAHQFLAKPCDSDLLKTKIDKTIKLRKFLSDEKLIKLINGVAELPSLPSTYLQLENELQKENISLSIIGDIIAKDITLSAKILKMVNSSFFGLASKITNISQAVSYLGINVIKSVLLYIETFGSVKLPKGTELYLESLYTHSFEVGNITKKLMKDFGADKQTIDDAYTAGILHNIGKLLLLTNDHYYENVLIKQEEENITFEESEKLIYGANHAEVGGYLLGLWGLPDNIVEAAAFHHKPSELPDVEFNILSAVHTANNFSIYRLCNRDYKNGINFEETKINSEYIFKQLSRDKIEKSLLNSL